MRWFLLLASVVATALQSPCLYKLEYPAVNGEIIDPLHLYHLDTEVINKYAKQMQVLHPSIDMRFFEIHIKGFCVVGPHWDYYLYKVSETTQMGVSGILRKTKTDELTQNEKTFLKSRLYLEKLQFLELNIRLNDWQIGKSTFESEVLSKDPRKNIVYYVDGSKLVFKELDVRLSGRIKQGFIELNEKAEPELNQFFRFPVQYECIFSNQEKHPGYYVQSSDKAWLVRSGLEWNMWKTLGYSEDNSGLFFHYDDEFTYETEGDGKKRRSEQRVYVRNKKETTTAVNWSRGGLKYWMIVLTKPANKFQMVDMSWREIVSTHAPAQARKPTVPEKPWWRKCLGF